MTQQASNGTVDSRIQAFRAEKLVQKTFSDSVADWFHGKFGDRKESMQSHEPVTWARYER